MPVWGVPYTSFYLLAYTEMYGEFIFLTNRKKIIAYQTMGISKNQDPLNCSIAGVLKAQNPMVATQGPKFKSLLRSTW
jgi:hypothetical protein